MWVSPYRARWYFRRFFQLRSACAGGGSAELPGYALRIVTVSLLLTVLHCSDLCKLINSVFKASTACGRGVEAKVGESPLLGFKV